MSVLRKLRGALGVGVTWGAAWGVVGGAIGGVIQLLTPGASLFVTPMLGWALGMGAYGLISGFGFSALLALGDGSRRLNELKLSRVAAWGILGSAFVPLAFGFLGFFPPSTTLMDVLGAIALTGSLGGGFAAGSVAAARRAELSPGEGPRLLANDQDEENA